MSDAPDLVDGDPDDITALIGDPADDDESEVPDSE